MWDPAQYLHFADERSRPFYDRAGRIGATAPGGQHSRPTAWRSGNLTCSPPCAGKGRHSS